MGEGKQGRRGVPDCTSFELNGHRWILPEGIVPFVPNSLENAVFFGAIIAHACGHFRDSERRL